CARHNSGSDYYGLDSW
nr:immunoglobulin heavy chain junction region [Macaca mulatta]MOW99558.1 immunoglobulin heavy chain junction region [Macaca mulatta]MOX01233.1 immunoglobulin heavy chain junction region [Macaca mulatta]MOX03561.1 immunoglobulin heavy chain junction region [Macaca mulatta]